MTATATLTSTESDTALAIIRALELSGPANWRTLRDCYLGNAHRAAMPNAMRHLIAGGHVISRLTPNRKYRLVVFERGVGLPDWIDHETYAAALDTPLAGIRRRNVAPSARSRR